MRPVAALFGLLALAPALRAESVAVVVGVAGYPKLEPRAKLKGTLRDADAIGAALKGYGFSIRLLKDADATKAGVLAALAQAAKDCDKPGDRFVFYFAGHGRHNPYPSIGPYDADRPGLNWIKADELNEAVKAIAGASSRTVILDACFSGAMIKDFSDRVGTRYYVPDALEKSAGYDDDVAPKKTFPAIAQANPGVCYIAASGPGQIAQEAVAPPNNPAGARRGVFSYYLERQLAAKPAPASWGAAVEAIQGDMIRDQVKLELLQPQNPMVSNPFAGQPPFAGATPVPAKPPAPTSVLKLLAADRPDPATLRLETPDETVLFVGQPRDVQIERNDPGYLFVAEQVGNAFRRIYPTDAGSADELYVDADSPKGRFRLSCDAPGGVVLKAFLLADKAAAQILLDALPEGKLVGGDANAVVKEAMAGVTGLTTATLNVRVSGELLGKLRIKDADKAWKILRGADARADAFRAALARSGFPARAEQSQTAPPTDLLLKTVLNLLLADRTLAANLALAKIPLDDLAPLAQARDEKNAPARNAQILLKLMDGALESLP